MHRNRRFGCQLAIVILLIGPVLCPAAFARDLHVDPQKGDDTSPTGPFATITRAIRMAQPGDTVHLKPITYRDYAGFYGIQGEPGKPITLDGHGATLEGSDPLDPSHWEETEPGLFRCDHLMPRMNPAILQRWFFLWDGNMQHMGRTSKGPSAPLKQPADLEPGEWTFLEKAAEKEASGKPAASASAVLEGAFYLRLPPGQKLEEAKIFAPVRSAGVQFSGQGERHNAHLVIRNLTATHPHNDGFNIHGHCEDVLFENIQAIECGDDGISAHETAEYTVDGFVSIGNSTGICDTGASQTTYNRVFIRDCLAFDLYFLDTGRYSVSNSVVLSSAVRPLYITGRDGTKEPCRVTLNNVLIRRITGENEVRVSRNSVLHASHVSLLGLNIQATGGQVHLHDSLIGPVPAVNELPPTYDYIKAATRQSLKTETEQQPDTFARGPLNPTVLLWRDVQWTADRNLYQIQSLRFDKTTFTAARFDEFRQSTGQDAASRWSAGNEPDSRAGAPLKELQRLAVPADDPVWSSLGQADRQ